SCRMIASHVPSPAQGGRTPAGRPVHSPPRGFVRCAMPGSMLWSFVVMTLGLFAAAAAAQEGWSPAPGPLMTRWAADVDPQDPLPEYPRPQLVRERWMNLNGL